MQVYKSFVRDTSNPDTIVDLTQSGNVSIRQWWDSDDMRLVIFDKKEFEAIIYNYLEMIKTK